MFLGTSWIKLDEAGRALLPPKARHALEGSAYLTKGQGDCLFLFSQDQFEKYAKNIESDLKTENGVGGMDALAFDRMFYASTTTITQDKSGRISIPEELRNYAGLNKDVAFIGMRNRIEIWDSNLWAQYQLKFEKSYSSLTKGVR